ncbi:coniferyl aldehyde dehydrogenase [Undibacterium sp. RTI2.1]|nr:coniferyl aldehyde dehydrogenase [Undibacterium sp. RTI2.1]MEB0116403.1 coniferyl aldehyde dehydrogenase [Undibacterium sp. RTI2.2]MEB0233167.1 coniferyl aldehyde dehydrogenase [Undibacterium sp. 10I3]MEB0257197.1 coniferyl aldehyde dehydrogenase [Undibacterium sp. 5I1]
MNPAPEVIAQTLDAALTRLRNAYRANPNPSLEQRLDWLNRLAKLTVDHGDAICEAISADFGHRSKHETELADLSLIVSSIKHTKRHLAGWMKPRRVTTALQYLPAKNKLLSQPLGVVGVIAPWNYPHQLAIGPVIAAFAAGNRVMLKPSEFTPNYSLLLAKLVADYFTEDELVVIPGSMEVGRAFSELPFDHLVFTGSTSIGRQVAIAAAKNLVPVTLELGGKSPAIIDSSADIKSAAASLAFGKLLNSGQTCVAPDYLLVPADKLDELVAALVAAASKMYPTLDNNSDYTSIINERHFARLQTLVTDAVERGAQTIPLTRTPMSKATSDARKLAPALVLNVTPDMRIMQEEIFGPLLPIVTYDGNVKVAIDFVNQRERPLALYWYGTDNTSRDLVLSQTVSGGVTINDCLWHLSQESQPFGGVGPSGMGAYHGEWGFRTLSKEKPVFYQSKMNGVSLLYPPYGKTFSRMLKLLKAIA